MDHLKQIESFVAAVTLGSFSAAARNEGVLPAVIGGRIDALEKRLSAQLIVRTTRGIAPTDAGRDFYESCKEILKNIDLVESAVSNGGKAVGGHLHVTAPGGFGRRHIAPLLPQLLAKHPTLSASLDLNDQFDALVSKNFDCAIRIGALPDSSLVSVRLADAQRMVVASPEYLREYGVPRQPSDLARHNCVCFNSGGGHRPRWQFRVDGKPVDVKVGGTLECTDGEVVYDWTLKGFGLAWRPNWEVAGDIAKGRLVAVLSEFSVPPDGVFAVFPRRQHLPLRVTAFVEFLRSTYRTPGYLNGL